MKNDRFLRALALQSVDATPVWLMRQAGRYLPEYRRSRELAGDFMTLCRTPDLACEVTLQPLRRFDLDAAILFSDILTIPDAMGLGLFFDDHGPHFKKLIETPADVLFLKDFQLHDQLSYVEETIRLIKSELNGNLPLIGFAGAPWTLATYMWEGGSSRDFFKAKKWIYNERAAAEHLLEILSDAVAVYLSKQIQAGADCIMLFDSWAGILGPRDLEDFSLRYLRRILLYLEKHHPQIPKIVFCKGAGHALDALGHLPCQGLGLDWTVNLAKAREQLGMHYALQGNLDPAALYAKPAVLKHLIAQVLDDYQGQNGHIFNLGHGVTPGVDPDSVKLLVDTVHELTAR